MTTLIPAIGLISLTDEHRGWLEERYAFVYAPDAAARRAAIEAHGTQCRVVFTNGVTGLTAAEIAAMPRLELICAFGAGYETVALEAARERGIVVANGAGTNDDCVADHALGLLIAAVRGIVRLDAQCRAGVWREAIPFPPSVSGRRLGILGMGTIGAKIARRAAAFDMEIGYHNRSPRDGVSHRYFDSLLAMAQWCDILVIATPGGPGTRHLVDAGVIGALGARGVLVNIARGSVVDTAALADALRAGRLAGAGLDVYESEPRPPEALVGLASVVLTPHVAGWSPESVAASVRRAIENAEGHFSGRGPVSPVR
jgi:lactate dehydrogenase-like 2-hydroxyacid dehydrogenase